MGIICLEFELSFLSFACIVHTIRFAILAADASAARSILVFKHDEDKVLQLPFFTVDTILVLKSTFISY